MIECEPSPPLALFELPNCTVCMDPLETDTHFLKCGHVFHRQCILNCMVRNSRECPLCKKRIHSEKDVKRLYYLVQRSGSIEAKIHQILGEFRQEEDGSVLSRALGRLRRVIRENGGLEERVRRMERERGEVGRVEEELRREKEEKEGVVIRGEKEKRELVGEIEHLKRYNSILEGDKESLEIAIKAKNLQLTKYEILNKVQREKGRESHLYESIKNEYLSSDPALGLQYFYQLSEFLSLDIKKLHNNLEIFEKSQKQKDKVSCELRRRFQQLNNDIQKEKELSQLWQTKYYQCQQKLHRLIRKRKEKSIQSDPILNDIRSVPVEQEENRKEPAMLVKRERREEIAPSNLFEGLGIETFSRVEKRRFKGFKIL